MYRRINLFGGPGSGKSTTAAKLFSELKLLRKSGKIRQNVELVTEVVKPWAYAGQTPVGWDQLHLFSEQLRREELYLRNGVDIVITDSPLLLNWVYSDQAKLSFTSEIYNMVWQFEEKYPSLNYFIKREGDYVNNGRFQTLDDSKNLDKIIYKTIKGWAQSVESNDSILESILEHLPSVK